MSTRELIERELDVLPESLQREVYDFARGLRMKAENAAFNGLLASESVLACDWEYSGRGRGVGKPVAGEIVVLPFPQTNL